MEVRGHEADIPTVPRSGCPRTTTKNESLPSSWPSSGVVWQPASGRQNSVVTAHARLDDDGEPPEFTAARGSPSPVAAVRFALIPVTQGPFEVLGGLQGHGLLAGDDGVGVEPVVSLIVAHKVNSARPETRPFLRARVPDAVDIGTPARDLIALSGMNPRLERSQVSGRFLISASPDGLSGSPPDSPTTELSGRG